MGGAMDAMRAFESNLKYNCRVPNLTGTTTSSVSTSSGSESAGAVIGQALLSLGMVGGAMAMQGAQNKSSASSASQNEVSQAINTKINAQTTIDIINAKLGPLEAALKDVNNYGAKLGELNGKLEKLNEEAGIPKGSKDTPNGVKQMQETKKALQAVQADKAALSDIETQLQPDALKSKFTGTTSLGKALDPTKNGSEQINETQYKIPERDEKGNIIKNKFVTDPKYAEDIKKADNLNEEYTREKERLTKQKDGINSKYNGKDGIAKLEYYLKNKLEKEEKSDANTGDASCIKMSVKDYEAKKAEIKKQIDELEENKSNKEDIKTKIESYKKQRTAAENALTNADATIRGYNNRKAAVVQANAEIDDLKGKRKDALKTKTNKKGEVKNRTFLDRLLGINKSDLSKSYKNDINAKKAYRDSIET